VFVEHADHRDQQVDGAAVGVAQPPLGLAGGGGADAGVDHVAREAGALGRVQVGRPCGAEQVLAGDAEEGAQRGVDTDHRAVLIGDGHRGGRVIEQVQRTLGRTEDAVHLASFAGAAGGMLPGTEPSEWG
jgi:hypothetical protein